MKITVVLPTYNEADNLADQIVIVDHGRVIAEGAPAELKSQAGRDVVEIHGRRVEDLGPLVGAVAAIGSMMTLAGEGRGGREGVRMGLWGAAQAIAFAVGGIVGTAAVDLMQLVLDSTATAYAAVFGLEAIVFLWAARLAARLDDGRPTSTALAPMPGFGSAVPAGREVTE